jgi:hypothetical protein
MPFLLWPVNPVVLVAAPNGSKGIGPITLAPIEKNFENAASNRSWPGEIPHTVAALVSTAGSWKEPSAGCTNTGDFVSVTNAGPTSTKLS